MNSHFQSSEATWTRSGFTVDTIGLRGLKSCEPTHATPPTRKTVMAGIDQTSISRRPEYAKCGKDHWGHYRQHDAERVEQNLPLGEGNRSFRIKHAFSATTECRDTDQDDSK